MLIVPGIKIRTKVKIEDQKKKKIFCNNLSLLLDQNSLVPWTILFYLD